MRFFKMSVGVVFIFLLGNVSLASEQVARINDSAKVLNGVDVERIAYALQTLDEKASVEGSVQLLNRIEEEYPRPVTARDLAIYILVPEKTVTLRVGNELKPLFSEVRIAEIIATKMKPSLDKKNFSDAVVDALNEVTRVTQSEGGIKDRQQTENGKALALVIGICSATVLMFLWMILFMNRFVGARVPLAPFHLRIIVAHAVALLGLGTAWFLEVEMNVGIVGMVIIPIVVIAQLALLFRVFRIVLPAVARS